MLRLKKQFSLIKLIQFETFVYYKSKILYFEFFLNILKIKTIKKNINFFCINQPEHQSQHYRLKKH